MCLLSDSLEQNELTLQLQRAVVSIWRGELQGLWKLQQAFLKIQDNFVR